MWVFCETVLRLKPYNQSSQFAPFGRRTLVPRARCYWRYAEKLGLSRMNKSLLVALLSALFLSSCASWKQEKSEYRVVDDREAEIYTADSVSSDYKDVLLFPFLGALSKSVYLTETESKPATTIEQFCTTSDTVFVPSDWEIVNTKIVNERALVHKQLKLGLQIYKETDSQSNNFVIVFRGTDFDQRADWASNFRWFGRIFSTKLDQYDEVRILVPKIIQEIETTYGSIDSVIAAGHSLGGGLAQLAGYSSHKINFVVAFDSSPVTGFYDIDGGLRRFNAKNLKIYRAYEHGEVLAYIRLGMKGLYPISKNDPDIVQVRFNLIEKGNVISQHDMKELACRLHDDMHNKEQQSTNN